MMALFRSRTAAALAGAALLSLTATPAMARGWHRHHDRGIDAGDVIAGLLIIGGVAAVASAASKSNKDRRARDDYPDRRYPNDQDYRDYRDYRDRDSRYSEPQSRDDYPGGPGWRGAGDMDAAVDACVSEVERGNRNVDTVDGVNRDADGWRVNGQLRDGRDYSCTAGTDGRVRRLTVDGQGVI